MVWGTCMVGSVVASSGYVHKEGIIITGRERNERSDRSIAPFGSGSGGKASGTTEDANTLRSKSIARLLDILGDVELGSSTATSRS